MHTILHLGIPCLHLYSPPQSEYPSQDECLHHLGVLDGVAEGERGAPTPTEHHPLVNTKMLPQALYVLHKVPCGVLLQAIWEEGSGESRELFLFLSI